MEIPRTKEMLMTLVPLIAGGDFADIDRAALAAGEKAYGQVLNTWAAIGNSPGLFSAYLPFLRQVNGVGQLESRIKELTAVRVAVLNHCRYTASHRCTASLANGATEAELSAIAAGNYAAFTEHERLALKLADAMTTGLPAQTRAQTTTGVPTSLIDAIKEQFEPAQIVELTMSISIWNALARFHRVMDFDLDMPAPPADVDSAL